MSHDLEAAWAATELTTLLKEDPDLWHPPTPPSPEDVTVYSASVGTTRWPHEDGKIIVECPDLKDDSISIALEYKRPNEGLHGTLTALGQGHAYLQKGYSGTAVVIPEQYSSHSSPDEYLGDVLEDTNPNAPIGVFGYESPDTSKASPFQNRIDPARPFPNAAGNKTRFEDTSSRKVEQQWAHVREGATYPNFFFRYLQTAQEVSREASSESYKGANPDIPIELRAAIRRMNTDKPPVKYLSSAPGDTLHDKVWRNYWFKYIAYKDNLVIWSKKPDEERKSVVRRKLKLRRADGKRSEWFSPRVDSKKQTFTKKVNNGKMSENKAWEKFAENVNSRAHSHRENLDSGMEAVGLLGPDGRPTQLGDLFVRAAERNGGDANTGTPRQLFDAALLQRGKLGVFLHYIHRLSEDVFRNDEMRFTHMQNGNMEFDQEEYNEFLKEKMENDLQVLRTVSQRSGGSRASFQAELALLRQSNFAEGFRTGLGLEINWPRVHEIMTVPLPSKEEDSD